MKRSHQTRQTRWRKEPYRLSIRKAAQALARQGSQISPESIRLVHPRDIHIDPRRGTAEIRGPITPEEHRQLAFLENRVMAFQEEVEFLQAEIAKETDPADLAFLRKELNSARARLARFQDCVRAYRGKPDPFDELVAGWENAQATFKKPEAGDPKTE